MPALGHSRPFDDVRATSAFHPKATGERTFRDGRKVPITIFCLIGKSDKDHVLFSIIGYRDSHSRRCRDLWCQASEGSALERGNPNNLTPTFRTNRHRFRVSIFGYKRAAMGLGMSGHISNRFPPKSWSGAPGYPSREFYKTHGDRRWNSPPCTQRSSTQRSSFPPSFAQ